MSDHDHEHDHEHEGGDAARDELIREMARRLAETPVRDLLLQTMATFIDLARGGLCDRPRGPPHPAVRPPPGQARARPTHPRRALGPVQPGPALPATAHEDHRGTRAA